MSTPGPAAQPLAADDEQHLVPKTRRDENHYVLYVKSKCIGFGEGTRKARRRTPDDEVVTNSGLEYPTTSSKTNEEPSQTSCLGKNKLRKSDNLRTTNGLCHVWYQLQVFRPGESSPTIWWRMESKLEVKNRKCLHPETKRKETRDYERCVYNYWKSKIGPCPILRDLDPIQ